MITAEQQTHSKKEEDKTPSSPAPSTEAAAPSADQKSAANAEANHITPASTTPLKPEMSKGEKWYNWTVYKGINYWVNLISSIAMADYFINKSGRQKLDWAIGKTAKTLEASGLMKLKPAYKNAKTALETLTLMSGGWLLLVPMKYMEDHKRSIVHWLNDKLGVDQTAPDGHKKTPDEIYIEQEQPPQTWFNVFKRRIMATLAVVGTGQVIEHALADKKHIKPSHAHQINPYDKASQTLTFDGGHMGGKEWLENKVVNAVNWVAKHLPGGEKFTKKDSWMQRWLGLAALDTGFTKITAVVMEMTNGAGKQKAPHEIGDDSSPPATTPIGDDLKPGEHRETIIVPDKPKAEKLSKRTPDDIIKAKQAGADFRESLSTQRSSEPLQMTV